MRLSSLIEIMSANSVAAVLKTGDATYLTREWLEAFLSRVESTPVSVTSFSVARGCSETDGFLSALHACSVTARLLVSDDPGNDEADVTRRGADGEQVTMREKKYELMLKSLAADPAMRKFMIESGWHCQEVTFYSEFLPILQTFVNENAAKPYRSEDS